MRFPEPSQAFALAVSVALICGMVGALPAAARAGESAAAPAVASAKPQPVLLGVFPEGVLTDPAALMELEAIDAWSAGVGGARTSIAGTFIDLDVGFPEYNIIEQVERAWQAGYTPMVKIGTSRSTAAIADGRADLALHAWGRVIASWAYGRTRAVFIAPFPEMNWRGNSYALDPVSFRAAFRRMQAAFAAEGVEDGVVRWVFAPNGWSDPGDPPFEEYFPEGAEVDVVGFSQYNWGYCPGSQWDSWDNPVSSTGSLFRQFLDRMRALAPGRPLFLLQTGTTAQSPQRNSIDAARKNQWLRDLYGWAAAEGVRGVMYFNLHKECDWEFFKAAGVRYDGYREAIRDPRFAYVAPDELASMPLGAGGPCVAGPTAMCLQGGRFRVEVAWSGFASDGGAARVATAATADSGLFYFYGPNNWELLVKVLHGCADNDRYWVFAAAATNLAYTLTVTDTQTGATRTYSNALGHTAGAITDTQAFATCP